MSDVYGKLIQDSDISAQQATELESLPYYQNLGYRLFSGSASYDRGGKVQIDDDPVLLCPNGVSVRERQHEGPVHIGTDF